MHAQRAYRISVPLATISSLDFYHKPSTDTAHLHFHLLPSPASPLPSLFSAFILSSPFKSATPRSANILFETSDRTAFLGEWIRTDGDWTEGNQASTTWLWEVDVEDACDAWELIERIGSELTGEGDERWKGRVNYFVHDGRVDQHVDATNESIAIGQSRSIESNEGTVSKNHKEDRHDLPALSHSRSSSIESFDTQPSHNTVAQILQPAPHIYYDPLAELTNSSNDKSRIESVAPLDWRF